MNGSANSVESIKKALEVHLLNRPKKPRLKELVLTDMTPAAFMQALAGESQAVTLLSAEGAVVFESELLTKPGLINLAWDGGQLKRKRANGQSHIANNPRVTVSLMLQPSVVEL